MNSSCTFSVRLLSICAIVFVSAFVLPRAALAEQVAVTGYAWSDYMGWISFDGHPNPVQIEKTTGLITGYAWSGTAAPASADVTGLGWISFNVPATGCPTMPANGTCKPTVNTTPGADFGKITGWARACSAFLDKNLCSGTLDWKTGYTGAASPTGKEWDGWIALSGTAQDGKTQYGLKQVWNATSGKCEWQGYAWGSTAIGAISASGKAQDNSPYGVSAGNDQSLCSPNVDQPDLTAEPVSYDGPTTAGSVDYFVSRIYNVGKIASANTGFKSVLQRADSYDDSTKTATNVLDIKWLRTVVSLIPNDPNSYAYLSFSYMFPTADGNKTRYLRVCADQSVLKPYDSGTPVDTGYPIVPPGKIVESNEDNNCGEWTAINVGCPASAPVVDPSGLCVPTPEKQADADVQIFAKPERVKKGNQTTITWRALNVNQCHFLKNDSVWKPGGTPDVKDKDADGNVINDVGVKDTVDFQSTYKIWCTPKTGQWEDTVTVNILPVFQEF